MHFSIRQPRTVIWGSLIGGWLIAAGVTLQTFSQTPIVESLPAPTILKPMFGQVLETGWVTVAGVTKNGTDVLVYVDGIKNGHIRVKDHPSGTASFSWQPSKPLKEGTYAVWVLAESELGLSLPSETIEFTIRKAYPRPTMRQPVVNKTTTYLRPYFVGVARSGDEVEVMLDGVVLGRTTTSLHESGVGSFHILPVSDLEPGWHSVHARSIAADTGKMSPWSDAYVFAIAKAGAPLNRAVGVMPAQSVSGIESTIPAPTLLRPAAQSFVTAGAWTIAGVVKNGYTVQLFLDDLLLTELAPADHPSGVTAFTYRPSSKLPHGDHQILARAVDREGRYSAMSQSVPVIIRPTVQQLTLVTQSGVTMWPPKTEGTIGSGRKVTRATTTSSTTTTSPVENRQGSLPPQPPQQPFVVSTGTIPEIAGPRFTEPPTLQELEGLLGGAVVTTTPSTSVPPVVTATPTSLELTVVNGEGGTSTTTSSVTLARIKSRLGGYRPGALVLILSGLIILLGIIVTFIRDRIAARKAQQVDFSDEKKVVSISRESETPTIYQEVQTTPPPPPPPAAI